MRIHNGAHGRLWDGLQLAVQARGTTSNMPGLTISITLPLDLCDELGLILHGKSRQMEPSEQAIELMQRMVNGTRDELAEHKRWSDGKPRRNMMTAVVD